MKTAIVWFKTDLRLEDNEALLKAIHTRHCATCIIFDDSEFKI
jgi:deoxyribodipyrimidine photo-lyase